MEKAIVRYQTNLIEKSQAVYDELLDQSIIPAIQRENEEELTLPELVQVIEAVDEVVKDFDQQIEASTDASERKHLRRQRKHPKAMRKTLIDLALRKQKYAKDMTIFGTRNSYAKTDQDATFMRMKDDYMRNGQLKAGYNVQIATEGQYALAYQIFPNPTDTLTLRPFLDEIEANYFTLPEHIVADAGYGSEQNYDDILTNRKREALITYNLYLREQKKKYQQNPFNTANWPYDETTDSYTCPNQQTLAFHHPSVRTDRNGFTRTFKVYQCENCTGCPFRASCTKAKEGNHRTLVVNEKWENQKNM